jgi:hypothetical protein
LEEEATVSRSFFFLGQSKFPNGGPNIIAFTIQSGGGQFIKYLEHEEMKNSLGKHVSFFEDDAYVESVARANREGNFFIYWEWNALALPATYESGDAIEGSMTFPGRSFAGLGLVDSVSTLTWNRGAGLQTVTLRTSQQGSSENGCTNPAPVPTLAPSTAPSPSAPSSPSLPAETPTPDASSARSWFQFGTNGWSVSILVVVAMVAAL